MEIAKPTPRRPFLILWPSGALWRWAKTRAAAQAKIDHWKNAPCYDGRDPGFKIVGLEG